MQYLENLADVVAPLDGVAHRSRRPDSVVVAPTSAVPVEVAGFDQVGDDCLRGAFGDPDPLGDIAETYPRVACDAQQGVGVVGQEGPRSHTGILRLLLDIPHRYVVHPSPHQ